MKFTPEVQAALQTLKNAAENDFERRRIDVLERDLTEPPTPEVIDDNHQRFNDVIYTKHASNGHYECASGLHRAVYSYYFGEIPAGYEIHHVDEDKSNNAVSNLQLLTKSEHLLIHYPSKYVLRQKKFICQNCGKEFINVNNGRVKFCPECRNPEKICPVCGKKFRPAVGRKAKCCSYVCAAKFRYIGHMEKRNCVICGKEFLAPISHDTKCCSRECGYKYRDSQR